MTIFGPDISSYQGFPNMGAVRAAGNDFVIIKATESTNYINPNFGSTRVAAQQAGLVVGLYHFARNGDPIAEARYFVGTIGGLAGNEFPVLDWEVGGDAANWSKAFLDEVARLTGVKAFVYLNQYYVNSFNWQPVKDAGYPLWVAIYDGDPYTFQPMRYWGAPPLKQYTDAASIPGIAGNVDRNSFNGSREQLLAYCKGGTGPVSVWEDDMALIQQTDRGIWLVGPGSAAAVAENELGPVVAAFGNPTIYTNPGDFDAVVSACRRSDVRDRVFGMLRQRYYKDNGDGTVTGVDPGTAGATPAAVLDSLDGNVLVQQIHGVTAPQVDAAAFVAALFADDPAVAKLGDAIAAGLATRVHNG